MEEAQNKGSLDPAFFNATVKLSFQKLLELDKFFFIGSGVKRSG